MFALIMEIRNIKQNIILLLIINSCCLNTNKTIYTINK